ncbi:hypothetical protein BKI52_11270 [marine bacterium AO1-C]|nr:hypothetical protein BKI52_11270 [marine bacterium AO1-C]
MTRSRRNIPERIHGNERRYLGKIFQAFKRLHFPKKSHKEPRVVFKRNNWVMQQSHKLQAHGSFQELAATLKLENPSKEIGNNISLKKLLLGLTHSLKVVPQASILAGNLLIMKVKASEGAMIKICELTEAQLKLLHYSPQLLQAPDRLDTALGFSEAQVITLEEQLILTNLP